jgi:cation diffusion facilitator CzcD-associated flavoprotein CzcO
VLDATWEPDSAKWALKVQHVESRQEAIQNFDVVVTAIGRFNAWKLPDIAGIKNYKGHLRHASNWDKNFNPTGKSIAVIGNGASGIQVVPNLQKIANRIDHYARSPTWLANSFAGEGQGRGLEPNLYSKDIINSFEDPETYLKWRKELEGRFYGRFGAIFRGSGKNTAMKEELLELMAERLKKKPELLDDILPEFAPNCRRLTPGPGYLESLTEENVELIRTPIACFTEEGIVTIDGRERRVDAVICCTGANRDMLPPFPITVPGIGTLSEAWRPDIYTYLGTATPSFPNLLFIQGPNGTGHSGTVPNQIETQVTFIAQLLRKVTQHHIKTFLPLKTAADDFVAYSDAFFARTVWTDNCSSWANGGRPGGRIHGHWPGSASHLNHVRRNPRWEDWEWTYRSDSGNRFAYFGNGWTSKETMEGADRTPYLKVPESIDLRSYHEEWFNL